jgi:tRNA-splicing ligase RtcB
MSPTNTIPLEQIDQWRVRVPKGAVPGMRTDGIIHVSSRLLQHVREDNTPLQVANVATLPGIVGSSLAMPDIHWGYGFPIGGVAAFDVEEGIISPGGVGYDINCGVNLMRTDLFLPDVKPITEKVIDTLFDNIPAGVGTGGPIRLSKKEIDKVMVQGARWAVEHGYGWEIDLAHMEGSGYLKGADPDMVSDKARQRGEDQLGTLGSGNHFVEMQVVEEIYDERLAQVFGLAKNQICVMIHSGSRGFGYRICEDYLAVMQDAVREYGISLPDRQLACAPLESKQGKRYFKAMCAAANYGWANRLVLVHWARKAFSQVFDQKPETLGMRLIYDVTHNIARMETHLVDGRPRRLCVHRKGATRSLPAGHSDVPEVYRHIGAPVLIPGDMGRASYLLVGAEKAVTETFASTCHGAGRFQSRHAAIRATKGRHIDEELRAERGIIVRARGRRTLAEEYPEAYKDVDEVVETAHQAGLSRKVLKLRPLGAVKG